MMSPTVGPEMARSPAMVAQTFLRSSEDLRSPDPAGVFVRITHGQAGEGAVDVEGRAAGGAGDGCLRRVDALAAAAAAALNQHLRAHKAGVRKKSELECFLASQQGFGLLPSPP